MSFSGGRSHLVAARAVSFGGAEFECVLRQWIAQPELVIPPIAHSELVNSELTEDTVHRRLFSKRPDKDAPFVECVSWHRGKGTVAVRFEPAEEKGPRPFYYPPTRWFAFEHRQQVDEMSGPHEICVHVDGSDALTDGAIDARAKTHLVGLLERLRKWGSRLALAGPYQKTTVFDTLFPQSNFYQTYSRLKSRFGDWVYRWTEKTDPRKFVFEELAIAAYILCIWESDGPERKRFVDLGCGNGFLTYILSSEGHSGLGIDQSARKVWAQYGANINLRAETLDPSQLTFPDTDYIIGNHADELVPWVPIISHRSGYHVKFVHIPCCFFDFGGPYAHTGAGGRYKLYSDYLVRVGEACGYQVEHENIRIPSTKNIVHVGRRRTFVSGDGDASQRINQAIHELLRAANFTAFVPRLPEKEKQARLAAHRQHSRRRRDESGDDEAVESGDDDDTQHDT